MFPSQHNAVLGSQIVLKSHKT